MAGTLAMLEAAARVLKLPSGDFFIPTAANCLRRSPTLGMEFRPACATTWTDVALTGTKSTTFAINSLGLRDREVAGDGAARILALGDSCTWGWQVPQDAAYPQRLQQLLDRRLGGGKYRVINAGVPGYTSYQGLVYLRDHGLALQPRIVVIGFGFNDSLSNGDVESDIARQRDRYLVREVDDVLLTRSALWRWARTRRGGVTVQRAHVTPPPPSANPAAPPANTGPPAAPLPGQPSPGGPPSPNPLIRVPPDRFKRNLLAIVDLAREHDATPFLLSFAGDPRTTRDPYGIAIGEVSTEQEVPLLIYEGPRIDIVHPTADGYAWLADQLLIRMTAAGWIPG